MDPNQQQHIEQDLFQNWNSIRPQLTETFAQVSRADLDPARSITELVQRISLKTGLPDQFIERQVQDIVQGTQGGYQSKGQVNVQNNQSFGSSQERQQGQQERQYATAGGGRSLGG